MSARSIGEILAPMIERTKALNKFQSLISGCATLEARKEMILVARHGGLISDEEMRLLIETYQLETA